MHLHPAYARNAAVPLPPGSPRVPARRHVESSCIEISREGGRVCVSRLPSALLRCSPHCAATYSALVECVCVCVCASAAVASEFPVRPAVRSRTSDREQFLCSRGRNLSLLQLQPPHKPVSGERPPCVDGDSFGRWCHSNGALSADVPIQIAPKIWLNFQLFRSFQVEFSNFSLPLRAKSETKKIKEV